MCRCRGNIRFTDRSNSDTSYVGLLSNKVVLNSVEQSTREKSIVAEKVKFKIQGDQKVSVHLMVVW